MDGGQTVLTYIAGLFILYVIPNVAVKYEEIKNSLSENGLKLTIFIARVFTVFGFATFIHYALPEKVKIYYVTLFIFASSIYTASNMLFGLNDEIKKFYEKKVLSNY